MVPKNGPKVKKGGLKTKNNTKAGNNSSLNWAVTKMFLPQFKTCWGSSLTSNLLIFDFWAYLHPKKAQIPQNIIVFFIENWDKIGPWFLDILIAR